MTSNAKSRARTRSDRFDGVREGRAVCHQSGGGDDAGRAGLKDGAIYALGEAEVVGIDDETAHDTLYRAIVRSGHRAIEKQIDDFPMTSARRAGSRDGHGGEVYRIVRLHAVSGGRDFA